MTGAQEVATCPSCESPRLEERVETHVFQYGEDGPGAVMLTATYPTVTCQACGFAWCDWRAEDAHDAAIAAHRGRAP